MRRDVFQAIADPTRREIINLLSDKHLNINEVAEHFSTSRPAISKHIRILEECGLVSIAQEGRERYCSVDHSRLKEVSDWTLKFERFWTRKLRNLEDYLSGVTKPQINKKFKGR